MKTTSKSNFMSDIELLKFGRAFSNTSTQLKSIIDPLLSTENRQWLAEKTATIIKSQSAKDLYLAYSLIASKIQIEDYTEDIEVTNTPLKNYLLLHKANTHQLCRIYLLAEVLEKDADFFISKVANIINLADTSELETFLKFLILLPHKEHFAFVAADTLRTNIATIFDALALKNPYPALFFNHDQWNQMYLKAAFMERNLSQIVAIDEMANSNLARIISDYAHERWAASRTVNPYFWKPVSKFMDAGIIKDMKRLLESAHSPDNQAAALCCFYSENEAAQNLMNNYPELLAQLKNNEINWKALKN